MALWCRAERKLYAKLVYYGPSLGGKTTSLEALHRIADPRGRQSMLAVESVDDRTLFFDFLPFELGEIFGYEVTVKVFTVPGQVRYDVSRQVVLHGADAVLFVADSSAGREEQNRWSLQNLQLNMRATGLDTAGVPVVFQLNKQDLPEAAPEDEVASWLRIPADSGIPSVAIEGQGVLEPFAAACRVMLSRLFGLEKDCESDMPELGRLDEQLERALAPHRERLEARQCGREHLVERSRQSVVRQNAELLHSAIGSGVELAERLAEESRRATVLARRMRAPLNAIVSSATRLRESRLKQAELREIEQGLIGSAEELLRLQQELIGERVPIEEREQPDVERETALLDRIGA